MTCIAFVLFSTLCSFILTSFWWPLTFAILDDIFLLTGTHAKCLGIVAPSFYTCLSVRWLGRFHLMLNRE